jgi:HAD superfamily hydrolase (TIGR01549 family)
MPNPRMENRKKADMARRKSTPALLFDLDGTLIESVYEHVAAWREAFDGAGIDVSNARSHRLIGMSGKLLLRAIFADAHRRAGPAMIERLEQSHKKHFAKRVPRLSALPGARELLANLTRSGTPWAIATSGDGATVRRMLRLLHVPKSAPVITGDHVDRAKPEPDVFLEAANRLGVSLSDSIVVGDSVWDLLAARRAKALGVGLLSGGYGEAELLQAGAYRIYKNPQELLQHISDLGIGSE